MDSKYPSLRRPQMKRHYFQNKESSSTRWAGKVTLQDIDGLFDDMDSASDVGDELLPMSPMLKTFSNTEKKEMEREPSLVPRQGHLNEEHPRCQMVSKGDVLHPAMKSVSPEMDIDMDIPFKEHGPIKTSSPIEGNLDVEERDHEKDRAVSPVLFVCEDDVQEELKTVPLPTEKGQSNGKITNESGDDEVESPPNKFALSKSKTSIHTKKVELSCKETGPVTENTPKKHLAPEAQRKTPMQGNADPRVSAVRQEPQHPSHEKKSEKVYRQPPVEICTHVGKDITAFLQKVREAGQPKPACPRKPLTLLKVPTPPPEPEDDFLILEDDAPLWFAIPSKTAHRMSKSRQRETTSTDEERPAYKGVKDSQPEKSEKQKDSGLAVSTSKGERQTVNQKTKKKKGKQGVSHILAISTAQTSPMRMKAAGPAGEIDEVFSSQEDLPAGDIIEKDKQHNKKQRQHSKIPSKESKTDDKAEDQPKQSTASESVKGKSTLKMEKKKAQKSSEVRRSKSLKDGKENAKKSRVKSLNGNKERIQGSDAVKEPLSMEPLKEQSQEPSSEEQGGAADLHSPGQQAEQNICPAKKNMKPEDPANGKAKLTKTSSADEDNQVLWKRKRNKPGEWWLSCTQSSEEAKVTDDPPMLKTSKQNRKRHREAVPSPIKPRKDGNLKDKNQKLCAPSSNQTTGQKSVKKARLTKKRTKRTETPDKTAETDKDINVIVAEQIQDHQAQVLDQELDPEQLSPLVFPHREHSLASGDNIFDRVYHHAPNEKLPSTPAPISPKRTRQHVKIPVPEKRRRKAPGNWWRVDDTAEDAEGISSQPQKPHCMNPKTHKREGMWSKQRKSPALGTPKNGNMAVSPKPLGGAPEPLLKQKPPAPNNVRRSLAIFKDIFISATESPPVANARKACQKNRRKMLFPLQEEQSVQNSNVICCLTQDPVQVPATDCNKFDNTDNATATMDAAEFRKRRSWPSNHEMLRDGKRLSDSTLKGFRSGPPSMIELEHYEENMLSASEMCGPPLRPLVLQVKDKANLTEWLKVLWPATVNNGGEIIPDQFEWYFYQGRAMGFCVDLHCGSFCNGKILLGSYMKKPLWVDHNATTVFNVSTSCVIMTIDGKESHFNPGQSFVVPCGHAYSIQNLTEEPAALYFNRMLAESPD